MKFVYFQIEVQKNPFETSFFLLFWKQLSLTKVLFLGQVSTSYLLLPYISTLKGWSNWTRKDQRTTCLKLAQMEFELWTCNKGLRPASLNS